MPPKSQRSQWFFLGLIVLAGLGLRIWYASWDLTDGRYWDEQYSLDNVRPIMLERSLKPVSGYYPSPVFTLPAALLFEGSAALGRATGNPALAPMNGWHFTSAAILLSRLLMTLYGCGTVILVFLIARHMALSRAAGLLAAGVVAFSPWMIHASGYYKPDALLVMMVALAFYASLRAIESAQIRWYTLAGAAIALAMSAKLTGGLAAVPLMVATVMVGGHRDRRRAGLLAYAGTVSVGVFVLANPYWQHYLFFLSGLKRDYAMRAEWVGDTKFDMPARVVGMILDDYGHGVLFGALGLLGVALFAVAWTRRGPLAVRAPRAMLAAFVLTYTAAYVLQTSYFKGNNFLPLLPFTAVAAACTFLVMGRWLVARVPAPGRMAIIALLTAVALGATVPAGFLYVYRSLVPTTHDLALHELARKLPRVEGRLAFLEDWNRPKPIWEGQQVFAGGQAALGSPDALLALPLERLRAADGVVFRLSGSAASQAAREALGALGPHKKKLYEPRPFVLRGPPVVSVRHVWTPNAPAEAFEATPIPGPPGWFEAALPPGLTEGEVVSFSVWVPHWVRLSGPAAIPHLSVGERSMSLFPRRRVGDGDAFLTERFVLGDVAESLRLIIDPNAYLVTQAVRSSRPTAFTEVLEAPAETISVQVHRWRSGR